jgi:hypothetical protein
MFLLQNWIRNRNTLEFFGLWEKLNNTNFKPIEFEGFKNQAGLNSFSLIPKRWIESTNAIRGIISKSRCYGGGLMPTGILPLSLLVGSVLSSNSTSPKSFKDSRKTKLDDCRLNRTLSKINYRIHTEAIKEHIIPELVSAEQTNFVYANEADILNVAVFGQTAKQWRDSNSNQQGNIRDHASIEQLLVLAKILAMILIRAKL